MSIILINISISGGDYKIRYIVSAILFSFKLLWQNNRYSQLSLLSLNIVSGVLPLTSIWLSQELVNRIAQMQSNGNLSPIIMLFLIQVTLFIFMFLIQQLIQIQQRKLEYAFGFKIKKMIINKVQKLPYITFETPDFYNQFQRMDKAQTKILKMVTDALSFIREAITIISVLLFLISISKILLPILIIGIIPIFVIQLKFGSRRFYLTKDLTPYNRKESYTSNLLKRREPLKEIKTFKLENFLLKKWEKYYKLKETKEISLLIKQNLWLIIARIFLLATYASSGILVFFLILGGKVMVGSFVAILQAIQKIQASLNNIAEVLSSFYESSFLVGELQSFFNTKERNGRNHMEKIDSINRIDIRNLTFYYPKKEKHTIKNIELTVSHGKKIAIVGENGSGKTTLIKCLTGLYESENSIKINGIPLENIDLNSYHRHLSVLFQDFNKYHFTAHENIGFGNITQLDDTIGIRKSAAKTHINTYLSSLENGYQSKLGRLFDEGTNLSGGAMAKGGPSEGTV